MYFQLLGPLEVSDHARPVALGGGKRRVVLALLLLHPNEVVPAERLIDALWGERPPATSAKALQVHISQLRRDLHGAGNGGMLKTRSGGYLLQLGQDDLDVHRFERALAEGGQALSAGDPLRAAARLRSGLALWRIREPGDRRRLLRRRYAIPRCDRVGASLRHGKGPPASVVQPRALGRSSCDLRSGAGS
jgi:DNA-binding SARP family transcriptional activator